MKFIYRLLNTFGVAMIVAGFTYLFATELQLSGSGVAAVLVLALLGVASTGAAYILRERIARSAYVAGIGVGVVLLVVALVVGFLLAGPSQRGLDRSNLIGTVLLVATGVFCFFIAIMIKAAPALEYMAEHQEAKIDRSTDFSADKSALELPPPPSGVHIPGPSPWPVLIAASAALIAAGLVFHVQVNGLIVAGAVLTIVTGAGWFRQAQRERQALVDHEDQGEHAAVGH